jgi:hypothetical protein
MEKQTVALFDNVKELDPGQKYVLYALLESQKTHDVFKKNQSRSEE